MKKSLFIVLLSLAFAVQADPLINVGVDTSTGATSDATNQGNTLQNNFTSPGKQTIKSAPSFGLGSFSGSFSSDYCSGTAQAAVSGLGFGVGGGGPVVDDVCQYLRVYERTMQAAASSSDPLMRATLQKVAVGVLCKTRPEVKEIFQAEGLCLDPKPAQQQAPVGSVSNDAYQRQVLSDADYAKAKRNNYTGTDPVTLIRLK